MRDEELVLRFFAFHIRGIDSYRTPQKHWLNEVAKQGKTYSEERIGELHETWRHAIDVSLLWFEPSDCFRRGPTVRSRSINRALFDLTMNTAVNITREEAPALRDAFRERYATLLNDEEFSDLISRAVDHTKRTKRRFAKWEELVGQALI
jgi:hypothetical protein